MSAIIFNCPDLTATEGRVDLGLNKMEKVINGVLTREDEVTNELENRVRENVGEAPKTNADQVTEAMAKPEAKKPYDGTQDFINISLVAYENKSQNRTGKSPDFRIFARKDNVSRFGKASKWLQTGAIWKKSGNNGEFLSMILTRETLIDILKEAN